MEDAKGNLQKALSKKIVDRVLTQQDLSKIEIGTERKRKFENDLDILKKKKKKKCSVIEKCLSLFLLTLLYKIRCFKENAAIQRCSKNYSFCKYCFLNCIN